MLPLSHVFPQMIGRHFGFALPGDHSLNRDGVHCVSGRGFHFFRNC